jgi:branched-chain amino acid transport system ATP-binding protein
MSADDAGDSAGAGAGADAGADAPPKSDAVLTTEALTRRFGELTAVDGVDLRVERGEFRSVIGPNGAGKTTLFDLITGAQRPTSGSVRFDGEDVTDLAPHERVRRGLGRSFQITTVFSGLTVRENVRLAAQSVHDASISRVDRFLRPKDSFEAIAADTTATLERVGLADRAEERAGALAYGDRRRLEIGLVLATDAAVVLLDEPTAGMSAEETAATMELIDEVLADRTLVLIEHDVDLVLDVSDRVTVLDRGQVLTTGSPEAVADDEDVQEAYLGGDRG